MTVRNKILLSGLAVAVLTGCNYNELLPEETVLPPDPDDLVEITTSNIISSFDANSAQTIQFVTAGEVDNIGNLNFYTTHDVTISNAGITSVIINFHGLAASDPNVKSEYNSMVSAVSTAGASSTTLILAPHFFHEGTGLVLDWENAVWRAGGKATTPSGAGLSSSQIVDYFLTEYFLSNPNFPDLENVIIAGHSAGGQMAQRYAAISRVENNYPGYSFSYLAANASHFVYPNHLRWNGSTTYVPSDCFTYNDYPYGLDALAEDSRYAFIGKIGLETIRGHYINRKVYYVLGEDDTFGSTTDCESQSQQAGSGDSRYERGQFMAAFMNNQYPTNEHEVVSVAGAGHSADAVYTSSEFVNLLDQLLD